MKLRGILGVVLTAVAGDYQASLAADSRFEVLAQEKSGGPLYMIRKGRAHILATAQAKPKGSKSPQFTTPNTTVSVENAEFEVSVAENGLADFMPLAGKLQVAAQSERLEDRKSVV